MKKYEKEVEQAYLDNEKATLRKLEKEYKKALDEINEKIEVLLARSDADMAHVIYQTQYQQALKGQIEGILKSLQANEFETISEYLTESYNDGFIGTLYAMQKQGVPFAFPVRQELVVSAIQHETKLSSGLYKELGIDMTKLKNDIAGEISRGIVTNSSYAVIARNVSNKSKIPLNRSMTIARTESHRIIESAQHHVQQQAVDKGADVVKIWDANLDRKTRKTHMELDGQIREVDEPFTLGRHKAMYPGDFGIAKEDINCRCRSRCEAKWALDATDTKALGNVDKMTDKRKQEIADKLGVPIDDLQDYSKSIVPINAKNYNDFKDQYNKLWHPGDNINKGSTNAKTSNYLVRNHTGVTNTLNERRVVNEAISMTSDKVKAAIHAGTVVDVGKKGASQYDYNNDILYIAKDAQTDEVVHEIGHLVENKMIDSGKLTEIRKAIVGEPTIENIKSEIYYDASGNPQEIFILDNKEFVSEYQGRIYTDNILDAFDEDGNFRDELLWEFVSEPFRVYTMNPDELKEKSNVMYDLIKEVAE